MDQSSTSLSASPNVLSSSSSSVQIMNDDTSDVPNSIDNYTTSSVTICLKYKKDQYTIVDKISNAPCWSVFGLPAKILGPDNYEIIKKFASCKNCFQTYSYSSTTSTLSNHKCSMTPNKSQSKLKILPVERQTMSSPTRNTSNAVNSKAIEKQKRSLVTLMSEWVCSGTRPISIIEDDGLKNLIDHCIQIGICFSFVMLVSIYCFFHFEGYMYGPLPSSSLVPCRKTVKKEIKHMASVGRSKMKNILIEAAQNRCLTLSPDIWSDGYKKISYLGCTAQWVDKNWNLCTFELFCIPFRKPNKTSANVLLVSLHFLSI
jgi:hypothetical protein